MGSVTRIRDPDASSYLLAHGSAKGISRGRLADVIHQIDVYDSAVRTGNAALDVILTEKSLTCEYEDISFSCIADGDALAFMGAPDLYAFLGTALDDAIKASCQVPEKEKRSISLSIRSQMGMAAVGIKNFRLGELFIQDGLPVSGGISLETILAVVDKYGGTLVYSEEGEILSMDALIPIPVDQAQSA
ncbi:MAG: GHKL domain-containing protein [Clostridia bacterium]|nr:GHKL domain-containing protein [Clostridia bacterium]